MMDYRENAGYVITDSCHVGDSEFVLGVHLTAPQQFVTWKCSNRTDYDWGHYFSDLFSAQKDLVARAQEEVQCQFVSSGCSEATVLMRFTPKFARSENFSYLAVGYLKCGIFVQLTENKPLPFRYLLSYTKM